MLNQSIDFCIKLSVTLAKTITLTKIDDNQSKDMKKLSLTVSLIEWDYVHTFVTLYNYNSTEYTQSIVLN